MKQYKEVQNTIEQYHNGEILLSVCLMKIAKIAKVYEEMDFLVHKEEGKRSPFAQDALKRIKASLVF